MKEGKYIYCITELNKPRSFGPLGIGDRDDELHTICFQNVGAVVSNSPITKYSVSRENMLAHEKAIEEVMKEHTVLPVRFATIADDEEKVRKILEKEYDRFVALLKDMKGKKELGLKAIFKKDVIYTEILKKYEGIRALKEKIAVLPPEETYYKRMEIGKMVEAALQREKEIYKKIVLNSLLLLAAEVETTNNYGERMIINAAFLVEKHKEEEFDRRVYELSDRFSYKIKFKYVGTSPPFNFVNLVIETGRY